MIESGVTFDCGQFVIDNDVARMIKHTVAGIPVSDDTLAVDDIHRVGPHNDFLSLDTTLRRMREQSQPVYLDRRVREDWEADGGREAHAVALDEARRVLREHRPEPLPGDVATRVRSIVEEADRRYVGA